MSRKVSKNASQKSDWSFVPKLVILLTFANQVVDVLIKLKSLWPF